MVVCACVYACVLTSKIISGDIVDSFSYSKVECKFNFGLGEILNENVLPRNT